MEAVAQQGRQVQTTPYERVLSLLKVEDNGRGTAMATCPTHVDEHASLRVSEGLDGRVLLYCNAGCRADAIVFALGLTMRDLFPLEARRRWRHPHSALPRPETLTEKTARVLSVLRLLDVAGQPWQLSLGFTCPCCGSPTAWLRGGRTLVVECSEGCPQEAVLYHLRVQAAEARA